MAEPIRISALGRDAQVGGLYNYFTDVISTYGIEVPNDRKTISETAGKWTPSFFYQQPEKFKHSILGINSHLLQSINQGSVPGRQCWFADYLYTNSMDGDEKHAQVTLFFRVARRKETLDSDFLRSKIDDDRLKWTTPTHMIDEVVYGVEVICSMRKTLNLSPETKPSAEFKIYLAAKKYFDETNMKSTSAKLPFELHQVSCTVLSSIENGYKREMSFEAFIHYLQDLSSSDTGNIQKKWKPIEFLLRDIPAARIEARMWSDRKGDIYLEKERHRVTSKWMTEEIRDISSDPSLKHFPHLATLFYNFQSLMAKFWKKVEEEYKIHETSSPEKALEQMRSISNLLNTIIDLFAYRRVELEEIGWLLSGTSFKLLNSAEIEAQMASKDCKIAKQFVLKVEYIQDVLIRKLEESVGQQISNAVRPVLPIFSHEKGLLQSVYTALRKFASEAERNVNTMNYHIVLDYSKLKEGTTITVDYSEKSSDMMPGYNPIQDLEKKEKQKCFPSSSSNLACLPAPLVPTIVSNENQQLRTDKDSGRINPNFAENPTAQLKENEETEMDIEMDSSSEEMNDAGCNQHMKGSPPTASPMEQAQSTANTVNQKGQSGIECEAEIQNLPIGKLNLSDAKARGQSTSAVVQPRMKLNDDSSKKQERVHGRVNDKVEAGGVDPYDEQNDRWVACENTELHDNRRIAEIYADESRSYSRLNKKGSPNVYLLNATKKTNSAKINWFEICRLGDSIRLPNPKNHKIIILMGATGCGKSTLINGMVNYIFGVQWKDPFRFKCVREDEDAARNQAHSQTSSVTAYTLHHKKGMAIPHSITIIDTPGYGDTRGVKRDKEITAAIHSFLTQQEIPINEIHAACFVAASGDSRLTVTQRYIIDSVLSIFGKDMKANLRLLVTFADNADPPVVGACLSANFPATSDGIAYSKFNSSVLYCSNVKQGDDEFSFDQLFWDMGHENFKKFFDMLERMKGRDLKSTREVIHSRRQLEQSLKDIEEEMEVCLINIESIEIFQRKLKTYGHNMEATKNFTFEQTEKLQCEKGYFAYNCGRCNKTCERQIKKQKSLPKKTGHCGNNACHCPPSDHKMEEMEWRLVPDKVTLTFLDMKAQYELNYEGKMDAEKMLDECSYDLEVARVKVLTLLEQVAKNVKLLESTALRSNVLSPSDYLSLMRSRVMEEQAPGYMTRLETLDDIQQMLANGTSQPVHSAGTRDNRQQTYQSTNPAAASNYGQEYNKPQPTQYEPISGDHEESKPKGRHWFRWSSKNSGK
ncbi:uncharacterized protein LOC130685825 [Daphnia carinata]|uniref:uncharacterized protein LOC130685825 n=1 Tax=Daphnia carinata TaxID=120202 RepID=UPI00257D060D|nr:uncharacterized protein LOC130685825 [Daphnia carinata]